MYIYDNVVARNTHIQFFIEYFSNCCTSCIDLLNTNVTFINLHNLLNQGNVLSSCLVLMYYNLYLRICMSCSFHKVPKLLSMNDS